MYKQDLSGYELSLGLHHPRLLGALETLRAHHDQRTLPLLDLPTQQADVQALQGLVQRFQDEFTDVVILGTGGSSLGGKTLAALAPSHPLRLHFLENVDPLTYHTLLAKLDPCTTGFLVISKSGETAETLMQFMVFASQWKEFEGECALQDHFVVITEDKPSTLRKMAQAWDIPTIDHDPGIGGRFSCLSIVGLLPAMLLNLDPLEIRAGAAYVLEHTLKTRIEDNLPALGALAAVELGRTKPCNVLMPYVDQLTSFTAWHRQLWAESLGKQGLGSTPIQALGTVDQHSQLQLYLDGPRDKFFTLLLQTHFPQDVKPRIKSFDLSPLQHHTMGELLNACGRATYQTLRLHQRPTRLMEIQTLTPETMGGLLMHFMLETILSAHLLGVNAFDQPAVESGKKLAMEYLQRAP